MSYATKTNTFIFIALIASVAICTIFCTSNDKKSKVLLLAGTSSAGKSTTTQALKKHHGDNYSILNIDDYIDGPDWENAKKDLATEWGWSNNETVSLGDFIETYLMPASREDERKKFDNTLNEGMVHYIKTYASTHNNIVIDTVQPYLLNNISTIVPDHIVVKTLLYCPLSTIGQRIEMRNASGQPEEQRESWLPFEAFPTIYKIQESPDEIIPNEMIVDSIAFSDHFKQQLLDNVENVRKFHFSIYDDKKASDAFENFYQKFLRALDTQEKVILTTRLPFDLIINTGINSPDEVATQIDQYLKSL